MQWQDIESNTFNIKQNITIKSDIMKLDIFNYISFYNLLYRNDNRKYHANNLYLRMYNKNLKIIKKVWRYDDAYNN
jgi:hypothetical protein